MPQIDFTNMYDGDLEQFADERTTWYQTVAMFVGLIAILGMGGAMASWWNGFRLPNDQPLWMALAVPSLLLARGSLSWWRGQLLAGGLLTFASLAAFMLWMPDK
jgi:hypothetical protein